MTALFSLEQRDRGEYAEACGTMRALEKRLLDGDRLEDLSLAGSVGAAMRLLDGWGWTGPGPSGAGWEGLVDGALAASDRLLLSLDPKPQVTALLVMKYEMLNLGAMLKARVLRVNPPQRLHPRGISAAAALETALNRRAFPDYPEPLARELGALGALPEAGGGRAAAWAVKKAHFRALLSAAGEAGSRFFVDHLRHYADLENIKFRLRALRRPSLWEKQDLYLPGGHLEPGRIAGAEDEKDLRDRMARTVYGPVLAEGSGPGGAIAAALLEKAADDFLTGLIRAAKYVSLGPEPLWAYHHARETDGKNIRAVVLGLRAGLDPAALRRQLRRPYA